MALDSSLPPRVLTVGHSTREIGEFLDVLRGHGVETLVDVRRFPASRRHPHFAREALAASLEEAGIRYAWMGDRLGGLRRAGPDAERHHAIRNEGFRAYAHHMESAEFRAAVDDLLGLARAGTVAILCAEALWWRCHRSFVADYLSKVRGVEVFHVFDARKIEPHRPRREARVEEGRLVYDLEPGREGGLFGD